MSLLVLVEVLKTATTVAVRKKGHFSIKDINEDADFKVKDDQSDCCQTRTTQSGTKSARAGNLNCIKKELGRYCKSKRDRGQTT